MYTLVNFKFMLTVSVEDEVNLDALVAKYRACAERNSAQTISVKQLRHVIPMLIMATFDCRPEPMLKKGTYRGTIECGDMYVRTRPATRSGYMNYLFLCYRCRKHSCLWYMYNNVL